jgi:hypothetical protein
VAPDEKEHRNIQLRGPDDEIKVAQLWLEHVEGLDQAPVNVDLIHQLILARELRRKHQHQLETWRAHLLEQHSFVSRVLRGHAVPFMGRWAVAACDRMWDWPKRQGPCGRIEVVIVFP